MHHAQTSINDKLGDSTVQFFKNSRPITALDVESAKVLRGAVRPENVQRSISNFNHGNGDDDDYDDVEDDESANRTRLRQLRRELAIDNADVDDEDADMVETPSDDEQGASGRRVEHIEDGGRMRRRVVFHGDEVAERRCANDSGESDDEDDLIDENDSAEEEDDENLDEDARFDLRLRRKQLGVVSSSLGKSASESASTILRTKPIVGSFQSQFPHLAATMGGSDDESDDDSGGEDDEDDDDEEEDDGAVQEVGDDDVQTDLSWKDDMVGKASRASKRAVNLAEV